MTGEIKRDPAPAPAGIDYEDIEAAVMESDRGRWFLQEFARRHRHAETDRLLEAIGRIEKTVGTRPAGESDQQAAGMRRAICEMAEQIAATKREIAAIRPDDGQQREISGATAELDAIVTSTENATSEILTAAEQVQELAWTLREAGAPAEYCDALDERATEIYTACSFQDITGQRTTKVVRALQMLEARINTMAELWSPALAEPGGEAAPTGGDAALLNGPALDGQGTGQDEVDRMMMEDIELADDLQAMDQSGTAEAEAEADELVAEFELVDEPEVAAEVEASAESKSKEPEATGDPTDLSVLTDRDYEALFT